MNFLTNFQIITKLSFMAHPLFRKKSIDKILADAQTGLSDSHANLNKVLKVRDLTFLVSLQ